MHPGTHHRSRGSRGGGGGGGGGHHRHLENMNQVGIGINKNYLKTCFPLTNLAFFSPQSFLRLTIGIIQRVPIIPRSPPRLGTME